MTLYWWSHWFWITVLSATINCIPIGSVDSISLKALQHSSKNYNKREPLKFPLAAQTDIDDIVDGDETIFKNDWSSGDNFMSSGSAISGGGGGGSTKIQENSIENISNKNNSSSSNINLNISNSSNNKSNTINIAGTKLYPQNATEETNSSVNINSSLNLDTSHNQTVNITSSNHEIQNIELNTTEINLVDITQSSSENSTEEILDEIKEQILIANSNLTTTTTTTNFEIEQRRKSKILAEYQEDIKIDNITGETKNLLARSAAVSVTQAVREENHDGLSEALSIQEYETLNAGTISGICLAVIGSFCGICFLVVLLYRRRYINKPQTLSEPDSSGYIDDSTIRDNSDEMYSLDNDSFLNSLEAMTIQNYWTDSVKHTKL